VKATPNLSAATLFVLMAILFGAASGAVQALLEKPIVVHDQVVKVVEVPVNVMEPITVVATCRP